jgi:cytoskeletal protein RodZ
MDDRTQPRFRIRVSTVLHVIVLLGLLLLVILQQVQINRMERTMAADLQERTQKLTNIIREQRDHIERSNASPAPKSGPQNSQPGR